MLSDDCERNGLRISFSDLKNIEHDFKNLFIARNIAGINNHYCRNGCIDFAPFLLVLHWAFTKILKFQK